MGSHLLPAEVLIKKWREAESSAAAAERALIDQARAHLTGGAASPTILQRTTAELLREAADCLLTDAMRKVEDLQEAVVEPERAAAQMAALKAVKP